MCLKCANNFVILSTKSILVDNDRDHVGFSQGSSPWTYEIVVMPKMLLIALSDFDSYTREPLIPSIQALASLETC